MASIKYSALISDIKGKLNGTVFSQGRYGSSIRNNKNGGGRGSALFDSQKSALTSISSAWRSLSDEQKQAWNDNAASFPKRNKFGDLVLQTGFNVFMGANVTLLKSGLPTIESPILPRTIPSMGDLQFYTPDSLLYCPNKSIFMAPYPSFPGGVS